MKQRSADALFCQPHQHFFVIVLRLIEHMIQQGVQRGADRFAAQPQLHEIIAAKRKLFQGETGALLLQLIEQRRHSADARKLDLDHGGIFGHIIGPLDLQKLSAERIVCAALCEEMPQFARIRTQPAVMEADQRADDTDIFNRKSELAQRRFRNGGGMLGMSLEMGMTLRIGGPGQRLAAVMKDERQLLIQRIAPAVIKGNVSMMEDIMDMPGGRLREADERQHLRKGPSQQVQFPERA